MNNSPTILRVGAHPEQNVPSSARGRLRRIEEFTTPPSDEFHGQHQATHDQDEDSEGPAESCLRDAVGEP